MTEKPPKKLSSRILTFDLMRGYFLVAIILDHLQFFPSGLDWWSARGALFVTTAEGFFLISGIVLGIVRGAKLIEQPFKTVTKLLFKRGLQLYLTAIVLILAFTVIGWWLYMNNPGLKVGIASPDDDFFTLVWRILTFQYFYGWADYLRLYAIFLFASPFAMWLLRKGKWYILLIINVIIWLTFPSSPIIPDEVQELLQPLTWQLLFFAGMTIGFHWKQISNWWMSRPKMQRELIQWTTLGLAAITLVINILIAFGPVDFNMHWIPSDANYKLYMAYFDKERLPITRIALFFLWFWGAFFMFHRFEKPIKKWLGWLLLPFGTNSLYVYTLHAFVIFFAHIYFKPSNLFLNLLVSIGAIGIIRIAIQYKFLMNIIPR